MTNTVTTACGRVGVARGLSRLTSYCFLGLLLLGSGSVVSAQVLDQARLVQQIRTGSDADRAYAVARIQTIPMKDRADAVLPALLEELERLRLVREGRWEAINAGNPPAPDHELAEYIIDVLRATTAYAERAEIIPYIIPFVASGTPVQQVLADFGERSFPGLIAMATSRSHRPSEVGASLVVLRRMLEQAGELGLSAHTRQMIADAARARLNGLQDPTVVAAAIDLALSTGAEDLISRVQEIAASDAGIKSLGLPEEFEENVQGRARAGLEKRRRAQ